MKWLRRDRNDDEPIEELEESVATRTEEGVGIGDDDGADTPLAATLTAGDGPSPLDGRAGLDAGGSTLIASTDVPVAAPADAATGDVSADDAVSGFAPASFPSSTPAADPGGEADPDGESPDPQAERRQLIDLLIYAWDRARSPGVWERLTEGLAAVGVSVLKPDGETFDPSAHEVGGTQDTDDDALVDRVAETEVVGFADRGRVIREPIVVVYRHR